MNQIVIVLLLNLFVIIHYFVLQDASLFRDHVTKHHFESACPICNEMFDLKSYPQHLAGHPRQLSGHPQSGNSKRTSKTLKPTILQPRNLNNSSSPKQVLIKPKPLELLLGYGVSDNYEILLEGKLVIKTFD